MEQCWQMAHQQPLHMLPQLSDLSHQRALVIRQLLILIVRQAHGPIKS